MPRGGLSPDPDKRERQLAALRQTRIQQGRQLLESQGFDVRDPGPAPKPRATAPRGVHVYTDPDPEDEHEPATAASAGPPAEPEPGPERRAGGFLAGLREGLADL